MIETLHDSMANMPVYNAQYAMLCLVMLGDKAM